MSKSLKQVATTNLFLTGELTERKYRLFIKQILSNPEAPLCVHICSNGGEVTVGLAIYDLLTTHPGKVTTIAHGQACSCASTIFQAGHERLIMPHAYLLLHDGSDVLAGTSLEVKSAYEYNMIIDNQFTQIYVNRMAAAKKFAGPKSAALAQRYLNRLIETKGDVYLTAVQCVELGLADAIIPLSTRSR